MGIIRPLDRLLHGSIADDRQGRAKLLLIDEARAVLDIGDDGRLKEVPAAARRLTPGDNARSVLLCVVHELCDAIELGAIIERPDLRPFFHAVADLGRTRQLRELAHDRLIELIRHIEPLYGAANLAAVLERAPEDLCRHLLWIHV